MASTININSCLLIQIISVTQGARRFDVLPLSELFGKAASSGNKNFSLLIKRNI